MPALALGNVFAIIGAGILDRLGQKYPSLSGEGEILKDHIGSCVEEAINSGDAIEQRQKFAELVDILEKRRS